MDLATVFGSIAGFCTTVSFIPQVVRIVRTKETRGISLLMYATFTLGIICWLIYGIFLKDLPIIVCNAVTLCLAVTILRFKIKYG
jgi:MtN3 and saliva related transmembrane protein